MQKIRFFFILFLLPFSLLAQQKTKIKLLNSVKGDLMKEAGTSVSHLKLPVFQHLNAILTCDSAVFYQDRNVFEAFNNVHINQSDTINIYSDHLIYDGNTKIAHLTSNVRMIDKENKLTTNILDYNMGTKVGTYIEGGKIVNKEVTLTSTNGYYFSNSRDAYFRYNVVVVTPQTRITSDTLRYNTFTNWAYFYGPTNIKGKEDNLYTENGAYNTKTEYAYFGKKNLYKNGTKSLKGDSLYYDGVAGYGKAVKNIVFKDTADKTVLYGQLGYYYKADERAVVTQNAYVGMGTKDSIMVNKKLQPDSIWMGSDTLETQMVLQKTLKLIESPVLKKDDELGEEEKEEPKVSAAKPVAPADLKSRPGGKPPVRGDKAKVPAVSGKDSLLTNKALKDSLLKEKPLADSVLKKAVLAKDSLLKDSIPIKKADSLIKIISKEKPDSLAKVVSGKADSVLKKNPVAKAVAGQVKKETKPLVNAVKGKNPLAKDSVVTNPLDTVRVRSIKAYHNVRVFKSNMQARADSLFYTSADSTLRWYGNPVLWSQNSQQTGDTIYLRLRNNKLNTLQVIENSFVVNVNADSAKFNQVKGKLITGFFKDGELDVMFVDGNAESVYYNRSDKDSSYTEMSQTVSGRIKAYFANKEISKLMTIKDPEGVKIPITELKEDVLLTGFTWKPELRPLSKKEVINGKPKPKAAKGAVPAKKPTAKKAPAGNRVIPAKVIGTAKSVIKDSVQKGKLSLDSVPKVTIPKKLIDSLVKDSIPALLKKQ